MEKITIEQAKSVIENAYGTIYSKEDVLAILDRVAGPTQKSIAFEISDEMRDELVSQITDTMVESIQDADCIDGYNFSMNYNEVQVDSIDVCSDRIEKMIEQAVDLWIDGLSDDDCGC